MTATTSAGASSAAEASRVGAWQHAPWLTLCVVVIVAVVGVPGMLTAARITGWDTPGIFASWLEWRSRDVPLPHLHTYTWSVFGGATLFKTYPPLLVVLL